LLLCLFPRLPDAAPSWFSSISLKGFSPPHPAHTSPCVWQPIAMRFGGLLTFMYWSLSAGHGRALLHGAFFTLPFSFPTGRPPLHQHLYFRSSPWLFPAGFSFFPFFVFRAVMVKILVSRPVQACWSANPFNSVIALGLILLFSDRLIVDSICYPPRVLWCGPNNTGSPSPLRFPSP